jgi:hypothetical protein
VVRIWAAGAARVHRCVPVFVSSAARRVGHVSGWEGTWEGGWVWVWVWVWVVLFHLKQTSGVECLCQRDRRRLC